MEGILYVTERGTNKITSFRVDGSGMAMTHSSMNSTGVTPFGFCYSRDYIIVSNAATAPGGMAVPNGSTVYILWKQQSW